MTAPTAARVEGSPTSAEVRSDDIVAITADVWSCFLGEDVHPLPDASAGLGDDSYLASIGIMGAWGGHVLLELPLAGAELAAKRMLGIETVTMLEVVDALGELSNMVGGNIKSLLPMPCHLGLPMVVQGTVAPAAGSDTVEICRAYLGWADSTVRVSVWARTRATRRDRT